MLVLSRKAAQRIRIGDDVTITIQRIRGALVQVGIEAPQAVRVLRAELLTDEPKGDCNGIDAGDA